jgi:hypothetical protein
MKMPLSGDFDSGRERDETHLLSDYNDSAVALKAKQPYILVTEKTGDPEHEWH